MKNVAAATRKMIEFYHGNRHDIAHFLKVWALAKTIGELEGLDGHTQEVLELAAVVHDIACPVCREKYGNTAGAHQEAESEGVLRPFLEEFNLPPETEERLIRVVSHHHTYTGVDGIDWQILLEADFLVNADESEYSTEQIREFRDRVYRTESGIRLLNTLYLREE